ncbi:hypothetical protein L6452_22342 [Arctium lappa]|uniref:Uncharacterized protein n=1 Tax=Arctium lappa TaxID=4217 RepID=A0ACB9AZU5_ARCLA|nr:hypothetical protein L6452_22342 [Arctium lappa]
MNNDKPMHQRRRKAAKTEVAANGSGDAERLDMKGKQETESTKVIKSLFFLDDQEKPNKHDDDDDDDVLNTSNNRVRKRKSQTPSSIVPDVAAPDLGYDLNLGTSSGGGAAAVKGGGDGPQRRGPRSTRILSIRKDYIFLDHKAKDEMLEKSRTQRLDPVLFSMFTT